MIDGFISMQALLLRERCLDGAENQILPRPQIAREFSLERLPNAARRQFLARADGGADELHDRGLEKLVRDWFSGAGRLLCRHDGSL